jgi:hypothetical protein
LAERAREDGASSIVGDGDEGALGASAVLAILGGILLCFAGGAGAIVADVFTRGAGLHLASERLFGPGCALVAEGAGLVACGRWAAAEVLDDDKTASLAAGGLEQCGAADAEAIALVEVLVDGAIFGAIGRITACDKRQRGATKEDKRAQRASEHGGRGHDYLGTIEEVEDVSESWRGDAREKASAREAPCVWRAALGV